MRWSGAGAVCHWLFARMSSYHDLSYIIPWYIVLKTTWGYVYILFKQVSRRRVGMHSFHTTSISSALLAILKIFAESTIRHYHHTFPLYLQIWRRANISNLKIKNKNLRFKDGRPRIFRPVRGFAKREREGERFILFFKTGIFRIHQTCAIR